jgi:hypothetical protein
MYILLIDFQIHQLLALRKRGAYQWVRLEPRKDRGQTVPE